MSHAPSSLCTMEDSCHMTHLLYIQWRTPVTWPIFFIQNGGLLSHGPSRLHAMTDSYHMAHLVCIQWQTPFTWPILFEYNGGLLSHGPFCLHAMKDSCAVTWTILFTCYEWCLSHGPSCLHTMADSHHMDHLVSLLGLAVFIAGTMKVPYCIPHTHSSHYCSFSFHDLDQCHSTQLVLDKVPGLVKFAVSLHANCGIMLCDVQLIVHNIIGFTVHKPS